MDTLDREAVEALLSYRGDPAVSLYLPTQRAGIEAHQTDPIRLKNVIREAEQQLAARGLKANETAGLLHPLRQLVDDSSFWTSMADGLAVFLTPERLYLYRLPLTFDELAVVSDRFHIKPLLPLLSGDGRFYLLTLSQHQVRGYRGDRHHLEAATELDLPPSLDYVLRFDDEAKEEQRRAGSGPRQGVGVVHGQGEAGGEKKKDCLIRSCQAIDKALADQVKDPQTPLVLAAVEYVASKFREVNHYPGLVDQVIEGNPEGVGLDELHAKAWAIVEPLFRVEREQQAQVYGQHAHNGKASSRLPEILQAAHAGRVGTLWVACAEHVYGRYDPATQKVQPADQGGDLLDLAAGQVLLTGGTVYGVPQEEVPGHGLVAAVFRY